jgi:phosphogluconate dehydratase
MSGASGKVPAAIHVTPECAAGGALARVQNGDLIVLDAERGVLEAVVEATEWNARQLHRTERAEAQFGIGRELFAAFRARALSAEEGAVTLTAAEPAHADMAHPIPKNGRV